MDIEKKCKDFIDFLYSGSNSVRDLNKKADKIGTFFKIISNPQSLINSPSVINIIKSILDVSIIATQKSKCYESIPNFFLELAKNNIPLAIEEKDGQIIIDIIKNIIYQHIPKATDEIWSFWLRLFLGLFRNPTFYNLFGKESEENDENLNYIPIESLFTLIDNLMRYDHINKKDNYFEQRPLALNLFSTFVQKSPYPPLPDTINSIINILDSLSTVDLSDDDFNNLLIILNEIIPISPISFLIDSNHSNSGPFKDKILNKIYDNWLKYQSNSTLRKSASTYLLLYLTTFDALNCEISQLFIEKWVKRIIEIFLKYKNKEQILQSSEDIQYLRIDIEFLKRSNDPNISKCLIQYILPNKKFNSNSNIIWLFTAIGLYAPEIIEQEDWLQILGSVDTFKIGDAFWLNTQIFPDFLELISVMVDVIESRKNWNKIFEYLMENQPSKDPISSFYNLISKILAKKRIDIKVAYKYQSFLWNEKSNPSQFSIEKLRAIQTSIFYYGFADVQSRSECFSSLICLLDYTESLSTEYLKQLALTVGSVISSYPFQIIQINKDEKLNEKSIDFVCQKLKKLLEMTQIKEKIETPLQTEDLFFIAPECSQIQVGDENDDDEENYSNSNSSLSSQQHQTTNLKQVKDDEDNKFELCNFISPNLQSRFLPAICEKTIKSESNEWNFMLHLTSLAPNFFPSKSFYDNFEKVFNEACDVQSFPSYLKILSTAVDEIKYENFSEFFEKIEEKFFDVVQQYIQSCDDKIREIFKDNLITWNFLNSIQNEDFLEILPLLAEFAVKISPLVEGKEEIFYSHFQEFLPTSTLIPSLNLRICSSLLKLSPPEQQETEIINSLENNTVQILQNLFVPVKDREIFINELFKSLIYSNSQPMDSLFKTISNYSITPKMKSDLLNIIKNNYKSANQIFDCFWSQESYSPFFIQDEYPLIRLQSIDTIISILKLKEFIINNGYEDVSQKLKKDDYFNEFISPFIKEIFDENDWENNKQTVFTAIKTLIQISAEIPELTLKCLFIIFDSFTKHNMKVFSIQTIKYLFSGLSNRAHFSVILRQFIPILIRQLNKLTDRLNSYPFELFYYDKLNSFENSKKMFCEEAAPYAIPYAIVKSKQEIIDFFKSVLNKEEDEIFNENSVYICSYILDSIDENSDEEKLRLQELYTRLMFHHNYSSPIPLLSFLSMASEESIINSYKSILEDNAYTNEFFDFRNFIFILYSKIIKSHHELVHSHYIQQFTLYVSILFTIHKEELEQKQTLYSDILALTVNMIDFVPRSESSKLLMAIASNIPNDFNIKMVGFVKNIEDICQILPENECLEVFFTKFPKLINKILIFDFLKERQLEIRTPFMEFKRIAKTRRLNQESIDFLLPCFIDDSESIDSIDLLPNEMKRTVLTEVYQFANKNPQTLALHLYSEMFLNFIDIHPSPFIIDSDLNAPVLLFEKILELARDKRSSICRSALTALHEILSQSLLPEIVIGNEFLKSQLDQYKKYARPRKKTKKPDEDSSVICKLVCGYIEKLKNSDLLKSPNGNDNPLVRNFKMFSKLGNIAAASPEFCQQLFPLLFSECLKTSLFDQIYSEFLHFSEEPEKYFIECRLIISTFNYLRATVFQENSGINHLKWCMKPINFQKIMEVCLKIGDPYSAYQFAEFALESGKINDEPLDRIFTHLGVNDLMNGLNRNLSDPFSVADIHKQEGHFGKALILYDNMNNVPMMKNTLNKLHLYNLVGSMKSSLTDTNIDSLCRLRKWDVSSKIMFEMNKESHFVGLFETMQAFATNNKNAIVSKLNEFIKHFHFDLNSSVYDQLSFLLEASALQWFHAVTFNESSNLFNLFKESNINNIYSKSLNKLNQLSHHFYKITESANELHGIFFCILSKLSILQSTEISFPEIPRKFFSDVISTSLENNEIESAQYFITLLNENQEKIPQFAKFEQIRVLYSENPHHAVSLFEKNYDQIILNENDLDSEHERNLFNLRVEFARASMCEQTNYLTSSQNFEQLENIVEKCELNESIELMADAEFTLARAYHHQHTEIYNYFMSNEYTRINEILRYENEYLISQTINRDPTTEKNVKQDISKYNSMIKEKKEQFSSTICNAIENYLKVLSHTSKYDLESSFSFIGLWFDYNNKKIGEENPDLIETMKFFYSNIDPIKFLPLFHQLAARVDVEKTITPSQNDTYDSDFQKFILNMVSSICQVKPNDCFPILFSLLRNNEHNKKGSAIKNLIDFITNSSSDLLDNWQQMNQLLSCYVDFAKYPKDKFTVEYSLNSIANDLVQCTTKQMPY